MSVTRSSMGQPQTTGLTFAQQLYASSTRNYAPPSVAATGILTLPTLSVSAHPVARVDVDHTHCRVHTVSPHQSATPHQPPHRTQSYQPVSSHPQNLSLHRASIYPSGTSKPSGTPSFTTTLRPPTNVSHSRFSNVPHTTAAFQPQAAPTPPPRPHYSRRRSRHPSHNVPHHQTIILSIACTFKCCSLFISVHYPDGTPSHTHITSAVST